jgi:S1-C subfamily serine protease
MRVTIRGSPNAKRERWMPSGELKERSEANPKTAFVPRPPPTSRRTLFALLATTGLLAGIAGGVIVALYDGGAASPRPASAPSATPVTVTVPAAAPTPAAASWVHVARRAARGVVEITVRMMISSGVGIFPGQGQTQSETALGGGFEIDRNGTIVTNDHVIADADSITVHLPDGTAASGTVVGSDPSSDLAVIRIRVAAKHLHPLTLGAAESLALGAPVLALGSPFGYADSATAGVVSGLDREIESPNGYTLTDAVQTDAAVNHGNSGGPLLDAHGWVVGVSDQLAESGVDANVGVAFAVPIDAGNKKTIAELRDTGKVSHAWLGIAGATIDAELVAAGALKATHGVLVTGIAPGSAAATGGLQAGALSLSLDSGTYCVGGDAITAIDRRPINSMSELQNTLDAYKPGTTITLAIIHSDGTKATRSLKLEAQPATPPDIQSGC